MKWPNSMRPLEEDIPRITRVSVGTDGRPGLEIVLYEADGTRRFFRLSAHAARRTAGMIAESLRDGDVPEGDLIEAADAGR